MARLRKFVAYRRLKRPYTRYSKYKTESYIRVSPQIKIARFVTGEPKKRFQYTAELIAKSSLNIRDNALESARQTSNRLLETTLGTSGYFLRVKSYPYHIVREHALATGAGADRFSAGMAHSFGTPLGNAARIKEGQAIIEISIDKQNLELARKALERASKKIPCQCIIKVTENSIK
jgi:large subunit ribosomal protein L10e